MGKIFHPNCAICTANRRYRTNIAGHAFYRRGVRVFKDMALEREKFSGGVGEGSPLDGPAPVDDKLSKVAPVLEEFMRESQWDDGSKRETATVLLFCEGGRWKAMLNDRDAGCITFVSGHSVEACLKALDKGLNTTSLDWRASKDKLKRGR